MARSEELVTLVEQLATSTNVADRAFAAGVLGLGPTLTEREQTAYRRIRETALVAHAPLRARIRAGTLDRAAFFARLRAEPAESRDQLVEEILDIAYPRFELLSGTRTVTGYCPSGLEEVLFTIEHAGLGPDKTFVDLGSGLGKVVLLAALLTGARAIGVEHDPALVAHSRAAAAALGLARARFVAADLRDAALPPADTYYMFMPSADSADVVARLAPLAASSTFSLFCQPLPAERFEWLARRGPSRYWLECYESRGAPDPASRLRDPRLG